MRLVLLVLFVPGLATAAPGTNELTSKDIAAAQKTYVAKCAKCHRFYEPKNYTEPDWQTWMQKMKQKSKLNAGQADLLKRYLDTYRAGHLSGKPEDRPQSQPGNLKMH